MNNFSYTIPVQYKSLKQHKKCHGKHSQKLITISKSMYRIMVSFLRYIFTSIWWTIKRKWSIIVLKNFAKYKRCVARNVLPRNILFCLAVNVMVVTQQVNSNQIQMQTKTIHTVNHPTHHQHVHQVR